jgi:hypothetical protein
VLAFVGLLDLRSEAFSRQVQIVALSNLWDTASVLSRSLLCFFLHRLDGDRGYDRVFFIPEVRDRAQMRAARHYTTGERAGAGDSKA